MHGLTLLAASVHWGGFKWTGSMAWAEGSVTRESLAPWETAESQEPAVCINHAAHGAALEVQL